MKYYSTRNKKNFQTSAFAILNGLSDEGGLFVPESLEEIRFDINDFVGKPYTYIAKKIISSFFSDLPYEKIESAVMGAYSSDNFTSEDIFPVHSFDNMSFLDLTTGNTLAFKDAALSILPYLMQISKESVHDETKTLILTATSGDTGKAAMEGFKHAENIDLIVFYPYEGVSPFQLKQMLTTGAVNEKAYAVKGNFDDAQSAVKVIFNDTEFKDEIAKKNIHFSSANSINVGRLIPQIVYYYHAYAKLVENSVIKAFDKINIVVPTGNFGNILAAYYAYKTGLPVNKFICASNENNVLTDFFNTGVYNKNRQFKKTISPSMDILISSNLERLIFEITDRSDKATTELMKKLSSSGIYEIDNNCEILNHFFAYFATETEIKEEIKNIFAQYNYLIDPHTATATSAYKKYVKDNSDNCHTLIVSTASPYKFVDTVLLSLNEECLPDSDKFSHLSEISNTPIPIQITKTLSCQSTDETIIEVDHMKEEIVKFETR